MLLFVTKVQGAITLVGTIGAAVQGTSGAAVSTLAWGAGESRTAGNLLICFCSVTGVATNPSTPSGWTLAGASIGISSASIIFYKVAAGTDAAPTLAAVTSGVIAGQLAEFTGNTASPLDKSGFAGTSSSPVTAALSAADTASGELLIAAGADFRSAARSPNDTWTSNHATMTQAGSNNGVSSANHYSFGYSLSTTSNSGQTSVVMTASTSTSLTGLTISGASFLVAAPTGPTAQQKASFLQFFP